MATPKLYDGIRLLYAEPGEQFPEEFDPKCPWAIRNYTEMDRECFVDMFKWENSRAVVPLEDFENDPRALWEVPVMDVELREGATYIVVPLKETTSGKKVSCFLLHFFLQHRSVIPSLDCVAPIVSVSICFAG